MADHSIHQISDAELRMQLRGLPKERELERDLWPGIQASIQHAAVNKNRRPWSSFAMAASLAFIAAIALPLFSSVSSGDTNTLKAQVVSREVDAMDTEYHAALKEFSSVELAPEVKTQLQLLDDSASKLRKALNQSPQSTYLIPMLRRTYLQRLQLTQRAAASTTPRISYEKV
ncbi:MAG: hypothetical protein ACREPB_15455 [Arenimonas sp.]